MEIDGIEFGRVAILVLDYDPLREEHASESVVDMYETLKGLFRDKYHPSEKGIDVIALANEELVAKHQEDFERVGVTFFPAWRSSDEYRQLLRLGLEQEENIYLMRDIGRKGKGAVFAPAFRPKYVLDRLDSKTLESYLEIIDPDGKIDIRPRQ